ncbi:hypothetical protein K474DRAFT_269687 [Panus rudis PR-1116 ss-1]|nr:hypothetical protein K474DRAFT_269687 [Panus rudis PR-1116 ss-1]
MILWTNYPTKLEGCVDASIPQPTTRQNLSSGSSSPLGSIGPTLEQLQLPEMTAAGHSTVSMTPTVQPSNLSPFDPLPTEILTKIVTEIQDWSQLCYRDSMHGYMSPRVADSAYQYSQLLQLTLVCRRWRATILGCPSLWSMIHSQMSPVKLNAVHGLSAEAPITIICNESHRTPTLLSEFKAILMNNAMRAHFLKIS